MMMLPMRVTHIIPAGIKGSRHPEGCPVAAGEPEEPCVSILIRSFIEKTADDSKNPPEVS
jgi:hypothetical protein